MESSVKFDKKENDIVNQNRRIIFDHFKNDPEITNILNARDANIKYGYMNDEEEKYFNPYNNASAIFVYTNDKIYISQKHKNDSDLSLILMHEMCHAYSSIGGDTGFFNVKIDGYDLNLASNNGGMLAHFRQKPYSYRFENRAINEAATEYYAAKFLNVRPKAYDLLIPIYINLSKVCGSENLEGMYFKHDFNSLIKSVKDSYHVDENVVKRLFILMDASIDIENGSMLAINLAIIYKILFDMTLTKLMHEKSYGERDINKYIKNFIPGYFKSPEYKYHSFFESIERFIDHAENTMDKFGVVKGFNTDIYKTRQLLGEFIAKKFMGTSENLDQYMSYFKNHLLDVFICLNQEITYNINGMMLKSATPFEMVVKSLLDKNKKLDLSNCSRLERQCILTNMMCFKNDECKPVQYIKDEDIDEYYAEEFVF